MGTIAYAIGYGIAETEHAGIEKVAVELAIQAEDIAYAGWVLTAGTGEGGACVVGYNNACLYAGIAEREVVRGG